MAAKLVQTNEVQDYLKLVSGLTNTIGKARVKQIVHRIVSDLFQAIEDLEITPEEFWTGVSYINDLGAAGEAGLLAAGLGLEHFLELRLDAEADDAGGYEFRTIMPSGYGCPPEGPTQALLNAIGRHGRRPAHIHFFVSAPGYRHLTTQINISGDPYLYDDFAFATRDGLVPEIIQCRDEKSIRERGLEAHFLEIEFDFVLRAAQDHAAEQPIPRRRLVLA